MNTQLTSANGFNTSNIVFGKLNVSKIPNSPLTYKRIDVMVKNPDGSIGELILPTERLFSFGFQENKSMDGESVNGYVLPLCLWNKNGATPEEIAWTDTFNNIVEHCKEYVVEHRDDIEQYELEMNDLKKFNPLYYKRERGKIVEGTGPTLYAKLIISRKHDKIMTMVYDTQGNKIDPLDVLGKYCYAKAAIKIESIFIGNKISLQVKVYETVAELVESGMKRLLGGSSLLNRPGANVKPPVYEEDDEEEEEEEGDIQEPEIVDNVEEEEVVEEVVPKKKGGGRRKKKE